MTRRSRRYFYWKKLWKENAPLADMTKMFDLAVLTDIMIQACKPIPKNKDGRIYPHFDHTGGPAIIGESRPEAVVRQDLWDVKIKMPFTTLAEGTYLKIDKP